MFFDVGVTCADITSGKMGDKKKRNATQCDFFCSFCRFVTEKLNKSLRFFARIWDLFPNFVPYLVRGMCGFRFFNPRETHIDLV